MEIQVKCFHECEIKGLKCDNPLHCISFEGNFKMVQSHAIPFVGINGTADTDF